MAFTTATANKILDCILRNVAMGQPAQMYVSLHSANPGDTGTNEIAGTTRQAITFSASATKATTNSANVDFTNMPVATITHVGLWSASSGGTFWWGSALTASKTTASGDTFRIPAGDFDVTLT